MFKSRIKKLEERVEALEKAPAPQHIQVKCSGMSIGENIKEIRKKVGMSQKDLASAVGVSIPMICQIERGTKSVTLLLGAEIAKVLKCDMNDLVGK